MGAGAGVISGRDWRFGGAPTSTRMAGRERWPGHAELDGWLNYGLPVAGGFMYRSSVEVRIKHPMLIHHLRVVPGGAAPAASAAPQAPTSCTGRGAIR